jgi:putative membrane protein
MKRWTGWMLAGTLVLGGTALAQDAQQQQGKEAEPGKQQAQGNTRTDDNGMFRMGEAKPVGPGAEKENTEQATGGSGAPQGPADAQASQKMKQGLLPVPSDEKAFLEELHHANQEEQELGQLARTKGVSKGVKDYGARMVREHQQADEQVMAYARKKHLKLGEPKPQGALGQTLEQAEKTTRAKLQALEGPVFDRVYVVEMVEDHDQDIAKVMSAQQQFASNAELSGLLTDLLPKLRQHRDAAYRLLGQEAPPAQARRGSTSGR